MRKARWAAVITFIQIVFALAFTPRGGALYPKLLNWDSDHYRSIAVNGYRVPDHAITSDDIHAGRANVVFLPGYPLVSRYLGRAFGLSPDSSLLVVAQLCAFLFWIYFFAFLELCGVKEKSALFGAFAIAVHPAAFYMVTGYTESLFLVAMLGFFYWTERSKQARKMLSSAVALLHGLLLCWTRIVGVAVAFYPVLRERIFPRLSRNWFLAFLIFFISVLSLIAFFAFCQMHFGDWAIYFHLEETGWQNQRLYFALFNPLTYVPHFFFEDTVQSLNKTAVTFTLYLFIVVGMAEWKIQNLKISKLFDFFSSLRGSLFLVSFGMFYIALTGKANSNLDSMLRYTFPVYALLVIEILLLNQARKSLQQGPLFFTGANVGNRPARIKILIAVIFGVGFQAWCAYRFTHGHWVA